MKTLAIFSLTLFFSWAVFGQDPPSPLKVKALPGGCAVGNMVSLTVTDALGNAPGLYTATLSSPCTWTAVGGNSVTAGSVGQLAVYTTSTLLGGSNFSDIGGIGAYSGELDAVSFVGTGTNAGRVALKQGPLPTIIANAVNHVAPTSVGTAYWRVEPSAAFTGLIRGDTSGVTTTESASELSGAVTTSGSNVVTAVKIPPNVTLTGTPSVGQIPTATSSTAATWQTPTGGTIAEWWSPAAVNAGALSATTQNATRIWSLYLPAQITSSAGICYSVATADNTANVYDIGLYNSSGTLLVDTGATAGTTLFASTTIKCVNWGTPATLPQGYYAIALTSSAASPLAKFGGVSSNFAAVWATVIATGGTTSGGVLNASITFPTTSRASSEVVNFSLH